jgi:hypothetical protein
MFYPKWRYPRLWGKSGYCAVKWRKCLHSRLRIAAARSSQPTGVKGKYRELFGDAVSTAWALSKLSRRLCCKNSVNESDRLSRKPCRLLVIPDRGSSQ